MIHYNALLDGERGAYGVLLPELGGCHAMGTTVDEALANAIKALRDWVEVTVSFGERVPPPQPLGHFLSRKDVSEAIATGEVIRIATVPLLQDPPAC
jgi:predicted RNase H-like HicB family nuclease